MKTILALLIALMCWACNNANKPLNDADKEKIVSEARELVSTVYQAAESCNPNMLIATLQNSPDFVSVINAGYDDYDGTVKKYPGLMSDYKSQKATMIKENYLVLDASTVLYTSTSKWDCILKNDSLVVFEPVALQFLLKKVDDQWKVLSWNEGYQL